MDVNKEENFTDEINHANVSHCNVGDKVKIIQLSKESMELEDYFYLKKFENKIGTITEKNHCKSGIYTYQVEFKPNEYGYFYDKDFILATGAVI